MANNIHCGLQLPGLLKIGIDILKMKRANGERKRNLHYALICTLCTKNVYKVSG